MKRAAMMTGMSVSLNGHRSIDGNQAANLATRYLCIAPHLRRGMLPAEVTEPVTLDVRSPLAVGRTYALRVLYGVEGGVPMPGIRGPMVRSHCRAALLQTILRDLAAVTSVVAAALLAPWSTLVIVLVITALVLLIRRTRLSSPLTIAAVMAVAFALVKGWQSRQSYTAPLICLGACFLIYFTDNLLSLRRIRRLLQQESSTAAPPPPAGTFSIMPFDSHTVSPRSTTASASQNWATRVYYDKDGIIGAGTSFSAFPITIPIDKPKNPGAGITVFTAKQILEYIAQHIESQGIGDERDHGYARVPVSPGDHAAPPAVHFTYGLPKLTVDTVVAAPVPKPTKHPLSGRPIRYLEGGSRSVGDYSPSMHPERHYTRAVTTSWDGQLVVSVYISASLQAHYLRMVIRPCVIGPIVSELKAVDDLVKHNLFLCACAATVFTARQFVAGAIRIRALTSKGSRRRDDRDLRSPARSTRERYAQVFTENMHQTDDGDRILRVLELKIAKATMDFLEDHNVDTGEYETQIIQNIWNQGTINSGTFTNSPVTTVTGQGNTTSVATNTAGGSGSQSPVK